MIGQGSRRSCYRMPEGTLCVKFYHDRQGMPARTRLSVRGELFAARFLRPLNVNAQEWRYYRSLQRRLPPALLSVFPEQVDLVYSETRGWGIIESLITNPDGRPARPLHKELADLSDPALRLRIYRETEGLLRQMVQEGVKLYDMPNLLLQWTGGQTFRLRIADFEPCGRGVWGWATCCRTLVQRKVSRRGERYLARLRGLVFPDGSPEPAAAAAGRLWPRLARLAGIL